MSVQEAEQIPYIEIYNSEDGLRWHVIAGNDLVIAASTQAYSDIRDVRRSIEITRQALHVQYHNKEGSTA